METFKEVLMYCVFGVAFLAVAAAYILVFAFASWMQTLSEPMENEEDEKAAD